MNDGIWIRRHILYEGKKVCGCLMTTYTSKAIDYYCDTYNTDELYDNLIKSGEGMYNNSYNNNSYSNDSYDNNSCNNDSYDNGSYDNSSYDDNQGNKEYIGNM